MRTRTQWLIAILIAGCSSDDNKEHPDAPPPPPPDAPPMVDSGVVVDAPAVARTFVYIESNDPRGNAVIAFERQSDGTLVPAAQNRFPTGGIGLDAGANQRIGPLDSDRELALSGDNAFLFAVNSGRNSIAAFRTSATGELTAVTGSPFVSNGANPVSIAFAGATMQVVNKAAVGTVAPNYASLAMRDGVLSRLPGLTQLPIGASPTIAFITRDQKLLLGTEFFDQARVAEAPVGQIDVFVRGPNGALIPAPGSPHALPPDTSGITPPPLPVALNLIAHPRDNVLYVGFPTRNQLGVYTYNANTGELAFVLAAPSSGHGIGWFLINTAGTRLYAVNSASATVSTYDLTRPRAPAEIDAILLKDAISGVPFIDAAGVAQTITSQPFQLAFDNDQSHIYVLSQRVTTNVSDPTGNLLHTLEVAADGTLREVGDPIDLRTVGVPSAARPQGVVVFHVQP
jgi:hypothetical protein